MNKHGTLLAAMLAAVSLSAFGSRAYALLPTGFFTETGDAGNTLGTAESTVSATSPEGSSLTTINGSLGNAGMDADLYVINITSPGTFSLTTNDTVTNNGLAFGPGTLPLDTALYLFDANGNAIAFNDDASGTTVTSTINAGGLGLTAGTYLVGISISGNEPVNSANQRLFATNDDSTSLRGVESSNNLNPLTLSTFDLNNYDDETGNYQIVLTGATAAAVPEPSPFALAALAGLALGSISLRRKTAQA